MSSDNAAARILGALYLLAFIAYAPGSALVESVTTAPDFLATLVDAKAQLILGAILMSVVHSAIVLAIGIIMVSVLVPHSKYIGYGYFSSIITQSAILIVGVIFLLMLPLLSHEYSNARATDLSYFRTLSALLIRGNYLCYQIGMAFWGIGGFMLCYLLTKIKLIPMFLSIWGLIGYVVFIAGTLLELAGYNVGILNIFSL